MQVLWTLFGWLAALSYLVAAGAVLLTLWQPHRRLPFAPLSLCLFGAI
ncbi:MAG: hypothetical protein OXFUSZZB_000428, partial [Candidatus Fervidibacter sp.]